MNQTYTIRKIEDFEPIKDILVKTGFNNPILICLNGELGAGKTVFVKYLGKELKFKEEINSPTFIIHNEYHVDKLTLHHLDLYRLEESYELRELHLERLIKPHSIIVIEWADKFENEIKKIAEEHKLKMITLNFEHIDENTRKVTLEDDLQKEIY